MLKNYLRQYNKNALCCTFHNDKKLYFNNVIKYIKPDFDQVLNFQDELLATFDYCKWQVEIYEDYQSILYDNYFIFLIFKDKIYIKNNYDKEIVVDRKHSKIVFLNNFHDLNVSNYTIPPSFFINEKQHDVNIIKKEKAIEIYFDNELILTHCSTITTFDDLSLFHVKNTDKTITNFYLCYKNNLFPDDEIRIYKDINLNNLQISSENDTGPYLILTSPNESFFNILPYTDNKEQYYIASDLTKSKFILISDISYYFENYEDFYFSISFLDFNIENSSMLDLQFKIFYKLELIADELFTFKSKKRIDNIAITNDIPYLEIKKLSQAEDKIQELIRQLTSNDECDIDVKWNSISKFLNKFTYKSR